MAGGGGGDGLRSLEETPTWAVAVVCFVLVVISIFIEHLIHLLGKFFMKRHKKALYEALEKVKSELMLLGFISLLLTVGQSAISEICVSQSVGDSWHPCKPKNDGSGSPSPEESKSASDDPSGSHGRKLLGIDGAGMALRRVLAGGGGGVDKCAAKGKVPLISTDGINQLHIFIFVLAVFHVIYCITTMILGRLKMRKWRNWERETKTVEYQFTHDPERFRFARETSFGRRHLSFWSKSPVLIWIVCFFRQFITSVSKVDYLALRHGFVMAHLAPQNSMNFDFQKYITKSLDEEFQVVVGISPLIWFFAVLFLLFNTHGWYAYYWLPFVPLIIILLVGTKLQVIITRMALRIMERGDVVKGVPVVQPADNLFWFNRPRFLLNLIHFVLFQNAFQVAFFVWSWYEFGIKSCFHEETEDIIIRISMGVLIHILCSYVTLPLYALVTQMGSNMKPVIFNERIATALKQWHYTARRNVKENRKSSSVTPTTSRPPTPSSRLSPVHLLNNYKGEIEIDIDSHHNSPKKYNLDFERFDADESTYTTEGSSSHHHGKNILQENRGLEMHVAGGSSASPANFTIPVLEEDPSNVDINFSFDKRLHRLT